MAPASKRLKYGATRQPSSHTSNTNNKPTLIQQLADPIDSAVRAAAFDRLRTWLVHSRTEFSAVAVSKLWRALYYMYWHTDGYQLQREIAHNIADIQNQFTVDNTGYQRCILYVRCALTVLHTEWPLIDRLRLDKFMYLIRCILNASFDTLRKHNYNAESISELLNVYADTILCTSPIHAVRGLQLYCIDIYLTELNNVLEKSADLLPSADQTVLLLSPLVRALLVQGQDRTVVQRIVSEVIAPLCNNSADTQHCIQVQKCVQGQQENLAEMVNTAVAGAKYSTEQRHTLLSVADMLSRHEVSQP